MRSTWNAGRGPRPGIGATHVLIGLLAAAFLLTWLPGVGQQFNSAVAYDPQGFQFWMLLTYPLDVASTGPIGFLFLCWWLYMVGTSLEGSLGPYGLMVAFWGSALLASLLMTLGVALGVAMHVVPGVGLPVASLTVLWGARNQNSIVRLFCLIPVARKWLAAITAFIVVFSYGFQSPLMGVFAGLPLLLMWLYGTNRIAALRYGDVPSVTAARQKKKESSEFGAFMDDVKRREHERAEKERLRKLFESSLADEDEKKG